LLACVESTLLYNAITWTITDTLERKLDGCYTNLLRYTLNYKWSDYLSNAQLYVKLKKVSVRLLERQLCFAGHCQRAKSHPVSTILFWDHTRLVTGKCNKGNRANYARQLVKKMGAVPGLVTSDVELGKLMEDRVE
jgi:hypothetical protein